MDFWTTNPELAEKVNRWGSMGLLILAGLAIIFWFAQPKDYKTGWVVLLLFALYLIVVLPLCVCEDKMNYLEAYNSAYAWNDFGVSSKDAGFSIYSGLVGRLFRWHVFPYFASIAAIYVGGIVFFAKKLASPAYVLPLGLSLFLGFGFWNYGMNGIRSGMALSLFMIGCGIFISGRQDWRKVALVIAFVFALSIHVTTLIPIAAVLLGYFFHRPRLFILGWLGCLVLSLLWGETIQAHLGGFFEDSEDSRIDYLTGESKYYRMGFRWDFIAYSCIAIAVGFFYLIFYKVKDRLYDIAICTYLAANGFWLLIIRIPFSNRVSYLSWFLIPVILMLPLIRDRITPPGVPAFAQEGDVPGKTSKIVITIFGQLAFAIFMMFYQAYTHAEL